MLIIILVPAIAQITSWRMTADPKSCAVTDYLTSNDMGGHTSYHCVSVALKCFASFSKLASVDFSVTFLVLIQELNSLC